MWLRYFNFFELTRLGDLKPWHQVEYRLIEPNAIIKSMAVIKETDATAYLQMTATTPTHYDRLVTLFKDHYQQVPDGLQTFIKQVRIPFQTKADFENCLAFLKKINDEHDALIFDEKIIAELTLIHEFIFNKDEKKNYQHQIPLDKERLALTNHYRQRIKACGTQSDSPLDDEFFWRENFDENKLKAYLLAGENPNVKDWGGRSAFYHAIALDNKKVIELMLNYGADAFSRDHYFYTSPFEHALDLNFTKVIKTIINFHSKFNYPIKKIKTWFEKLMFDKNQTTQTYSHPVNILSSRMERQDNSFQITYHFADKRMISNPVKACAHLNQQEIAAVFDQFQKSFYSYHQDQNTMDLFKDEVFAKNAYIDLLYEGERLIAFNQFQLFSLAKYPDYQFLNCNLAAIDPAYQGTRLMSLLTFRVGFALQQLYPNKKIGVYFTMLDKMGYRLVQQLMHYPKYQNEFVNEMVKDIIDYLYENKSGYYHDALISYVHDDLKVRGAPQKNNAKTIPDKFFYNEILAYKKDEVLSDRAAPVFFFADEDNFNRLKPLIERLGVDFKKHIAEFKDELSRLIHVKNNVSSPFKLKGGSLFFSQKNNTISSSSPLASLSMTNK